MTRDALLAALAGAGLAVSGLRIVWVLLDAGPRGPRTSPRGGSLRRWAARAGAPMPADLAARVAAAGSPGGLGSAEWTLMKWALAGVGALTAAALALTLPGRPSVIAALVGPAAGFLAPDALLGRRAARRQAAMVAELPDLVDRMRLAIEAGMPADRALTRAAAPGAGLLATELRGLAAAIALGGSRSAALTELCRRCPGPEVRALAALLTRSARHGAPLAAPLAALAGGLRAERARRGRERAAASAPKIQLVVALLLVPAALLVVAAALLAQGGA